MHLHKKMVINQIVKFHGQKDKERHLHKRLQLFIQERQFCQNHLKILQVRLFNKNYPSAKSPSAKRNIISNLENIFI